MVSTENFSVLINGEPREKISAVRGLRQGHPLPPFLSLSIIREALS